MAKVETFSAGCPACQEATELAKLVAGTTSSPAPRSDPWHEGVAWMFTRRRSRLRWPRQGVLRSARIVRGPGATQRCFIRPCRPSALPWRPPLHCSGSCHLPHQKLELDSLAATLHAEAILRGELPA